LTLALTSGLGATLSVMRAKERRWATFALI